jgi:hypothetical protein
MPPDVIEPQPHEPLRYTSAQTLVFNLAEQRQIAWIEAPVFLPEGAVIQIGKPNRDAVVLNTRLELGPGHAALLIVNVNDPAKGGEVIPRHPADRI